MKKSEISILKKMSSYLMLSVLACLTIVSCEEYDEYVPAGKDADLVLSANDTNLTLLQDGLLRYKTAVFNWTTGSTHGTGASISYILQIDKQGNNYSKPWVFNMGKANYSKSINIADLNDSLLSRWGAVAGSVTYIEARVLAKISTTPETIDSSSSIKIEFIPVTKELYLVGDATPNGWDIANAIPMSRSSKDHGVFVYQGPLKVGKFKLPVNRNTDWGQDMYMRDPSSADSTKIYLHKGGDSDDEQWEVKKGGVYNVTVNLYNMTISIKSSQTQGYNEMFMVGSATAAGWDITNAVSMVKDPNNPAVFKYDGMLVPGEFKFPVNRNADWSQDMFMKDPADSTKVYLHNGGDSDDSKWTIYKEGWYSIRLDVEKKTISVILLDKLYIIGSATPVGWNIGSAIELVTEPNGYEFTYEGELKEGEFKFPVDRSSSWGQDMFMKDPNDATSVYHHVGGDPDDSKWTLTSAEAGNYKVTINLKTMKISIIKQ